MRPFLFLAAIVLMAPFWLPQSLGGMTLYHYVVTGSMTGAVDRGSLVIVWPQEAYAVGDVVAFKLHLGEGRWAPILHRIIGKTPEGTYLIKGDAAPGVDEVPPEDILGKMVLGIPFLGYVGGAAKFFPLVLAFLAAIPFMAGRREDKAKARKPKRSNMFLPTAAIVAVSLPFASVGMVEMVGRPLATMLVVGLLLTARLLEVSFHRELSNVVDVLYASVALASLSMVYVPGVIEAFQSYFLS